MDSLQEFPFTLDWEIEAMNNIKLVVASALFFFIGCNETNELIENVKLTVANLPALKETEGHYQIWVSFTTFAKVGANASPQHDSGFVSLGEFNVDANGLAVGRDGNPARIKLPEGRNLQLLSDVVITVQRNGQNQDRGPAIIGGRFRGDASRAIATLDMSYADAFGSDFAAVSGKYAIMAPTSPADSNSGVWFVDRTPGLVPGLLNLSPLREWTYEGWVVDRLDPDHPRYYSTGKFLRANIADFDSAGSGRGSGAGLNFPGQDFINGVPSKPDLTLSRYSFMITVEPSPDNSPDPFFLQLLTSVSPSPAASTLYNVIQTHAPQATVTIAR